MLLCASKLECWKETKNSLYFRLIELNIEKMEEEIENLNSTVEEHDGIIGKGYFFSGNIIFLGNGLPKRQICDRNFNFLLLNS